MLLDAGCAWTLVGHSERRASFGESDALVAAKAGKALAGGLRPDRLRGRDARRARDRAAPKRCSRGRSTRSANRRGEGAPASDSSLAYEPVWAIGTGRTA